MEWLGGFLLFFFVALAFRWSIWRFLGDGRPEFRKASRWFSEYTRLSQEGRPQAEIFALIGGSRWEDEAPDTFAKRVRFFHAKFGALADDPTDPDDTKKDPRFYH